MLKRLPAILAGLLILFSSSCAGLFEVSVETPQPAARATLPDPTLGILPVDAPTGETPTSSVPAVSPTSTPESAPIAGLDDEQFDQQLAQHLENQDFEALRSMMKERFLFAIWNSELREIPAEEALQSLRDFYLVPGSAPVVQFNSDISALLGGVDPLALWGPLANPVRAMHLRGLGPQAREEAVAVIGRDQTSGELFWLGLLVPVSGSFQDQVPLGGEALATDVHYVKALKDVNARTGPGLNYAVEGLLRGGQVAPVSGVSADGAWWRIACTPDASGYCWISSDPGLTQPISAP